MVWLICWFLGVGIVGIVSKDQSKKFSGLIIVSGYALSQIVFLVAFLLSDSTRSATIAVFVISTIFGLLYLIQCIVRGNLRAAIFTIGHSFKSYFVLLVVVFVVVASPYVTAGFGNYWHSGNADAIDGLNGRSVFTAEDSNALVRINKITASDELTRQLKSRNYKKLVENTGGKYRKYNEHELLLLQDFLNEYGRLQYSSLAFWSKSLGLPFGMDALLLQALFNLQLMGLGVYLLSREIFKQTKGIALSASLLATLGHFYLMTFSNGHVGSLMYNAIAPFFIYFCLRWIDEEWRPGIWLVLPLLWLAFMSLCYPYPLLFLIAPLMLYWGYRYIHKTTAVGLRGRLFNFIRDYFPWIISVMGCVGLIVAWWIFEPIRGRAGFMFRSWATIFNHVGFLQFWGIWPSNLTNLSSMLGWLNPIFWLKSLSVVLATSISLIAAYGFYRIVRLGNTFMVIWLGLWLAFFVLMRFVVADSYYFYKFLYINAFMVMIALMAGMHEVLVKVASPLIRNASIGIFVVFLAVNLVNNAASLFALSAKPYNKNYSLYKHILDIPKEMLSQTYIDVPNLDHKDVLRQTVLAAGSEIQTDKSLSRYLLKIEGRDDVIVNSVSDPIWKSGILKLYTAPKHDLLNLASYWEPESAQDGTPQAGQTFRWMTGSPKGNFLVDVIRPSDEAKHLVFCAASGPSVDYQPVKITWKGAMTSAESFLVGQYGCHWLDLSGRAGPYVFSSDTEGHIVSAVESRNLTYRVFRLALSKDKYDPITLKTMTSDLPDIVGAKKFHESNNDGEVLSPGQLILGAGWFPPEQVGNDFFRWASNDSEIFVHLPQSSGELLLDIEPGPSIGSQPMRLKIVDDDNTALKNFLIHTRQDIAVRVPSTGRTKRVRLIVESAGIPVPNDPRMLNFRVFKVHWMPNAAPHITTNHLNGLIK